MPLPSSLRSACLVDLCLLTLHHLSQSFERGGSIPAVLPVFAEWTYPAHVSLVLSPHFHPLSSRKPQSAPMIRNLTHLALGETVKRVWRISHRFLFASLDFSLIVWLGPPRAPPHHTDGLQIKPPWRRPRSGCERQEIPALYGSLVLSSSRPEHSSPHCFPRVVAGREASRRPTIILARSCD